MYREKKAISYFENFQYLFLLFQRQKKARYISLECELKTVFKILSIRIKHTFSNIHYVQKNTLYEKKVSVC